MPSKFAASTMSAPCMVLANPVPCHRSPPSSSSERRGPTASDQGLEMRKAAKLAKAHGGFLEIDGGEGIGVGTVGPDADPIEKGAADQMRRLSLHDADAEIDARFAEIHRQQLRVGVG